MQKVPCVYPDDMMEVMNQLTKDLAPILKSLDDPQVKDAAELFMGTLSHLTLNIFDWLPPEQQSEVFTSCGTWFNVGLIIGRAPMKLMEILNRAKPRLTTTEIPDWLARRFPSE